MGCVQSYFRKAQNAGLSPSSTQGSEKAGIQQDLADDVADLVNQPEKEPLDVTDIQNEDEVILTEKPFDSAAPELNGTVKTDDRNAGKLIAVVTGTAAVIGAAAVGDAVKSSSEEKREPSEGGEVVTRSGFASVAASPAPAFSEADTVDIAEDGDVKSPLSANLGDDATVGEASGRKSDDARESEETGPASTPIIQDTARSNEEVPRETVPDDVLSTARSEVIPGQGSRPTSASQLFVNEEDVGSRPISAALDGTIPNSASSDKEESVPEDKQDAETYTIVSSSKSPVSMEQGIESQKDNRPVSDTASDNEASRPSSLLRSNENADTASDANEVGPVSSTPLPFEKNVGRPVSDGEGAEIPANATLSVEKDREETIPAGSETNKTIVSESRPIGVDVSVIDEASQPVIAAELSNEEGRPDVSADDTVPVPEDLIKSRPVSALTAAGEAGASEMPGGSPLKADELENDRIGIEVSSIGITTPEAQETERSRSINVMEPAKDDGTRPSSAANSNKEDGNGAAESIRISQEPTSNTPSSANNLEADEIISRKSAVVITEDLKGLASSRPVSASESPKDEQGQSVDTTESANVEGRVPVNAEGSYVDVSENTVGSLSDNAVEFNTEEAFQPQSAADKISVDKEPPVNITFSETYEESGADPIAENEVANESVVGQEIPDSVREEEVIPVRNEEPTKNEENKPENVFEDLEGKAVETVVLENMEASEERPVSASNSSKEEVGRPDSSAVPTESTSRPASSIAGGVTVEPGEGTIPTNERKTAENSADFTKEENFAFTAVGSTSDVEQSSVMAAESATGDERSRPSSAANFVQEEGNSPRGAVGEMEDEGGRTGDVPESIQEGGSGPVSSEVSFKEERLESTKEKSSSPGSARNSAQDESTPNGGAEAVTDGDTLVGLSGSTKDEVSRPVSIVANVAGPTQTSQDSVSGSLIEEVNVSASYSNGNVENRGEQTGTRPVSGSEVTNEGFRPTSSLEVKESLREEETETEVDNKSAEVVGLMEDVQASKGGAGRPTEEEGNALTEENQSSVEAYTVDSQKETKDAIIIDEVVNASTTPSALRSDGANSGVSKEASEQALSSSSIVEIKDSEDLLSDSAEARSYGSPSLEATVSSKEPGSDKETDVLVVEDKQTEDEEKTVTKDVDVEKSTEELSTAATIIQATFRGYQTRQTLSKPTGKDEVPLSATSHDFLFGPPVQQSTSYEETSVGSVSRDPETGQKTQEAENEQAVLQNAQNCDDIRATRDSACDDVSDADSSQSSAATKIQAGVRGFLARRHVHNMKTSNSTTAPSIGDSQQSLGDCLMSQEVEDEGVHTSGSLETEIQKQHQVTFDDEIYQPQEEELTTERTEVQNRLLLESQLEETAQKSAVTRSAISLERGGPTNEDEDRSIWETLQQQELDDAATKIQSNYRGYRMRRSLRREDAIQMPTTSSSSTITASSDVIPDSIRHSGEFHDMMVLPLSPGEDASDASAQNHVIVASSTPLLADDDVTSPAGYQETEVTGPSQGGEDKMEESADVNAATRIQASYRGFKTRQDIKAANTAASKIQAGFRGYKVRKQLRENAVDNKNGPRKQGSCPQPVNQETEANEVPASEVEARSATKIQAGVRGYLVRKRRQTEREAAVKIQAGFRGYQARRDVKARRGQQNK